jgi:hypothetical protein
MRRLFPKSRFLLDYEAKNGIAHGTAKLASAAMQMTGGMLKSKRVTPRLAAAKVAIIQPVIIPKCRERGCPFPVFRDARCRAHLFDTVSEYSLIPSVQRPALSGLRRHFA